MNVIPAMGVSGDQERGSFQAFNQAMATFVKDFGVTAAEFSAALQSVQLSISAMREADLRLPGSSSKWPMTIAEIHEHLK